MKLKHQCLVLDHDDTVVNSTATVHWPCFVEYMHIYHPEVWYSLEDYFRLNFDPGVVGFFLDHCKLTEEEMRHEELYWKEYAGKHIPQSYPGIREIMEEQKRRGGKIAVVSHSFSQNILRDYRANGLPEPDLVFGWEYPAEQRKPNPWPLHKIMETFGLPKEQLLTVDDLKPGYDMCRAASVPFAAAGWANDIPEIEGFMRVNCGERYFKTVGELRKYLFED